MFPFDHWHKRRERPSLALIFFESFLVTLLATATAWLVFPAAAGLIAVLLIGVGMQDSFVVLLECNRRDIWENRLTPSSANAWLTTALVVIFLGSFLGFSTIAWSLSPMNTRAVFTAQLDLSQLGAVDLGAMRFGSFGGVFEHNLSVFLLAILVSVVFRSGGALMILSWNASVWALSYAHVSRLTVALGFGSRPRILAAVLLGITPHLVLEAAAYITGTMVGIFSSKAFEKYSLRDPRFRQVIFASLKLVGIGVGLLVLGALIEISWPGACIRFFLGGR